MISKRNLLAPARIGGILLSFCLSGAALAETPGVEERAPAILTFDVREHRAMPDITNMPRIRFLTVLDFPPFSFLNDDGRLAGFNVDLARELCDELKVAAKCQIQAVPFDELETALETRAGDAVIAGVAATEALRARFDFSRPYLEPPARFLARTPLPAGPLDAARLNEKKIGLVAGTSHEAMFKAYFPALKPVSFETRDAMLTALESGSVDVVFSDGLQLAFWKDSKDSHGCCGFWGGPYYSRTFLGEGMRIMTRKSDPLAAAIDHGLLGLARDGMLSDLFVKYLPAGIY